MRLPTPAATLLALGFCGCVPQGLRSWVEVQDDSFRQLITVAGIEKSLCPRAPVCTSEFFLQSTVDRSTMQAHHQVIVRYAYTSAWRAYRGASGESAEPLDFTAIDSELTCSNYGCAYRETFGVGLSDDLLRNRRRAGLAVTAHSQSGHELVIEVPSELIEAQLAAIDERTRAAQR